MTEEKKMNGTPVKTIDLSNKHILITGGTRGIGLGAALHFAAAGARLYLTYKWGSAGQEEISRQFKETGNPHQPVLIQSDVSHEKDTEALMETLKQHCDGLDVFVSNVGFASTALSLDDYKKRSFYKTLDYSTWPLIDYTKKIKKTFGRYPRYVVGVSSDGPDHYYKGYDFVAASKSLLEFFTRYLAVHLGKEGSSVNTIRFGTVKTDSFTQIFGEEFFKFAAENGLKSEQELTPEICGRSILALCSGLMDGMNGQVLSVDYGLPFQDNLMMRYMAEKEKETR